MKVLVVTPMQAELDCFLRSCIGRDIATEPGLLGRLPVVRLPALDITLARGGLGKAQFALQTQHLLDTEPGWGLVVCAGAAGALVDELAIGDVVVATSTVEHDYHNKFNQRPRPQFDGDPSAVAALRRVSLAPTSFKVHFGPIASGDEDIVDPDRRRNLQQSTGALAVAWEGAGGARACQFGGVPFVEIRGLTDGATHNAPLDFERNLEAALANAATVITAWISQTRSSPR